VTTPNARPVAHDALEIFDAQCGRGWLSDVHSQFLAHLRSPFVIVVVVVCRRRLSSLVV
jgi:hypothetical protein